MFSLTLFGGNHIDVSVLDPGEPLVCLVVFGALEIDFTTCAEAPLIDVTAYTIFGGVNIKVRPDQPVRLEGFSVLGGRNVEPRRLPAPETAAHDDLPLELTAYAIFGGVNVDRKS